MTQRPKSSTFAALTETAEHFGLLSPLRPLPNLTDEVVARLIAEISKGKLKPGARLPTEHAMMTAMGISRTVVREAVAALKAQGYITTRHGSGSYVALDTRRRGFHIDPDGLGSIERVLELLELRMAIETEAAALVCERATAADIRGLTAASKAFERAVKQAGNAVEEDFAFHKAIAHATGNSLYVDFLAFLGLFIIPRQSIRVGDMTLAAQSGYLEKIQREHRLILDAMVTRDATAARAAARAHLTGAAARYRQLARQKMTGQTFNPYHSK